MNKFTLAACSIALFCACNNSPKPEKAPEQPTETISRPDNFAEDLTFLREFAKPAVLKDSTSKSAIAIIPEWQGRVITSSVEENGRSFGWLNYATIENGKIDEFSTYGGEDRFLTGPEIAPATDTAISPNSDSLIQHTALPAITAVKPLQQVTSAKGVTVFEGPIDLQSKSGHTLHNSITRTISLLSRRDLHNYLGADIHRSMRAVGFHSDNILINTGDHRWDTAYGTTSIRIRGSFPVTQSSIAIIPLRPGGTVESSAALPKERLLIKNNMAFFRADGNLTAEIGVKQFSALNFMGLYDPEREVLTIVQFTLPRNPQFYLGETMEDNRAEVLTIRNNGPENPYARGRFLEVQSASPAALLKPNGRLQHFHRTIHLQGSEKHLSEITKKLFGVTVKELKATLP